MQVSHHQRPSKRTWRTFVAWNETRAMYPQSLKTRNVATQTQNSWLHSLSTRFVHVIVIAYLAFERLDGTELIIGTHLRSQVSLWTLAAEGKCLLISHPAPNQKQLWLSSGIRRLPNPNPIVAVVTLRVWEWPAFARSFAALKMYSAQPSLSAKTAKTFPTWEDDGTESYSIV